MKGKSQSKNKKNRKKSGARNQRNKKSDKELDKNEDEYEDETDQTVYDETEVRKCAYCDIHTPLEVLSPNIRKKLGKKGTNSTSLEDFLKRAQKTRIEKARRVLADKRNRPPVVNLPTISNERLKSITEAVNIKAKFKPNLQKFNEK